MKQVLVLFFSLITIASCRFTTGSGNLLTETRTVDNFDGIAVAGDFDVEVKIGPVTAVVVEADDNILKYIETRTVRHTLTISTEGLHNFSDVHMKVYVTTPVLVNVKASASATVLVQDMLAGTGKLTFRCSSAADVKAEVDAPEIVADVSSGASLTLRGKTRSFSAEASSGSTMKSWDLLSENTTVKASSGATAKVHASVSLQATASSGATVTYHGAATVNKSVSSGATINKKE